MVWVNRYYRKGRIVSGHRRRILKRKFSFKPLIRTINEGKEIYDKSKEIYEDLRDLNNFIYSSDGEKEKIIIEHCLGIGMPYIEAITIAEKVLEEYYKNQ
ncbi:MAG: hypothetical protein KKG75_00515 [Nanoarchaeota archaeon]|nr:hypothetical protein [Nanoarchaeota archaeon]